MSDTQFHIQTDRLDVRNLRPEDLEGFHSYRSIPEVTRYQGFDVMNRAACAAFIDDHKGRGFGVPGEWVQYGIALRDGGQLIGDCAVKLQGPDPRIAEIGLTISPRFQQQGYGKEAMRGLLDFLFGNAGIHRVVETTDAENIASIRLLERCGFRQEGHFIENIFFKGKWGSEFQYAMLRREWEELD